MINAQPSVRNSSDIPPFLFSMLVHQFSKHPSQSIRTGVKEGHLKLNLSLHPPSSSQTSASAVHRSSYSLLPPASSHFCRFLHWLTSNISSIVQPSPLLRRPPCHLTQPLTDSSLSSRRWRRWSERAVRDAEHRREFEDWSCGQPRERLRLRCRRGRSRRTVVIVLANPNVNSDFESSLVVEI